MKAVRVWGGPEGKGWGMGKWRGGVAWLGRGGQGKGLVVGGLGRGGDGRGLVAEGRGAEAVSNTKGGWGGEERNG